MRTFTTKRRRRNIIILGTFAVAIPMLALAWYLGSPLLFDDEVNEDLPDDILFITSTPSVDSISDSSTSDNNDVPTPEATAETSSLQSVPEMSDDVTATEVRRGQFRDIDRVHQGSGDAILFQLSDGRHLLRFENFEFTNGPDLRVYLVPHANRDDTIVDGYIDLGQLKGNVGAQNYFVPVGVELGDELSVVIWCDPFRVTFSVATLES